MALKFHSNHNVNRHFGLVDEGCKVSSATKMSTEESKLMVQTVEATLLPNNDTKHVNEMSILACVTGSIITSYIFYIVSVVT